MRCLIVIVFTFTVCSFFTSDALSVEPNEILLDKALEARARLISRELRCPVCQNESIDESSASLAADLRIIVRERLLAGDSDDEVYNFVVSRYGEFVLLTPSMSGANILLWVAAPGMLLIGLIIAFFFIRKGNTGAAESNIRPLDNREKSKLEKIMNS